MATDANTALSDSQASTATPTSTDSTKAPKPVSVIEGMDSRRMFDSPEEAANYLNKCAADFSDFESVPMVIRGMAETIDSDGNVSSDFDPDIYTSDTRVMVAVLANRGATKGDPSTVKAIVVTPAPTLDAILADPAAKSWLISKVLDKELNHVAVRPLRTADNVETVADQMPLTLADYISSSRESNGGIMETFNTLYKGIDATLKSKSQPWAKARLIKGELKKALESKAYALATYPLLEDRGMNAKTGQPLMSLFVMALQLGEREAKKQGLDPAIFQKWLATRDQVALRTKDQTDEDSEDFELDDLAFVADEDKPAQPATQPAMTPERATAAG